MWGKVALSLPRIILERRKTRKESTALTLRGKMTYQELIEKFETLSYGYKRAYYMVLYPDVSLEGFFILITAYYGVN